MRSVSDPGVPTLFHWKTANLSCLLP